MILRNAIYILAQNNQTEKVKFYLEKFKSLIPQIGNIEIGISYAVQEADLYEVSGNFREAISILEQIAKTYEEFYMPEKAKLYQEEIKNCNKSCNFLLYIGNRKKYIFCSKIKLSNKGGL